MDTKKNKNSLKKHLESKDINLYLHPHSGKNPNIFFDLVAQLVEHLPFKERVPGSSPGQVTETDNIRDQNPANHMICRVLFFIGYHMEWMERDPFVKFKPQLEKRQARRLKYRYFLKPRS